MSNTVGLHLLAAIFSLAIGLKVLIFTPDHGIPNRALNFWGWVCLCLAAACVARVAFI